jgi:7-carboxy-7-deazaguanine synthase
MKTAVEPFLRITEIFHSIQGESTWAGAPCTFVRLTGCPLRCVWCDTAYAFHGGERMSLTAIVDRVREIGCPVVEITGGEPLAHPNAYVLARQLVDAGFTVLVETSGSEDVAPLPDEVHVVMDLKCPGSGETSRNRLENLDELDGRDEVKFVIANREDYEWARQMVRTHHLDRRLEEGTLRAVLFSPVWGEGGPGLEALAAWVLADGLPVRLQTQLHKHIWDPARRGV